MAEISKQDALEELRRRGVVTGGDVSVLEKQQELPTRSEFKIAVESLLKGSAKGIVNMVGGWGNLYDELASSKDPSAFSSKGIVNAIARMGGPDINKIRGWQGAYTVGEAGAPAAALSGMGGNLFRLSTPTRTAAAEFASAGGLGLLGQTVAPESAGAQLVMQSLPYLVKGGVQGIKTKAAEKRIAEYRDLLPQQDKNIFDNFILKGQGSTDPQIAADIARLSNSVKYGELVATLNAGASEKALAGMAPESSKLSNQEAAIASAQAIQNKLAGLKEHNADSLFEKARKYGGDVPLVSPDNTIKAIDALITRYSNAATPNAQKAVDVLTNIRNNLSPSFTVPKTEGATTVVREATPSINIPGAAARPESYQRVVTEYDSLGMPHQRVITENYTVPSQVGATIPGTPEVRGNIPGGGGFEVNKGPQPLTVDKLQGFLSEFGRKAGAGDQLIKDLAISDERIISSAIFGGLQDDLKAAYGSASGADKTALGLLRQARDRVATSVEKYNTAMAQGLPNWLKDKSLRDINFEELSAQYNKLTPDQRAYARSLIADTDAEALKALDHQTYSNFVNQARTINPITGVEGVDLGQLAQNWKKLTPVEKDNLTNALGSNASEFEQRMKYADVFAKRMRLAPEGESKLLDNATVREASAAAGAVGGYQVGKLTQLGLDTANLMGKEGVLTDDQLAKLLLPKEGLDFLKQASISPRGQKTLDSLMTLDKAEMPAFYQFGAQMGRAGARMGTSDQPQMQEQPQQQQQTTPQITPEQALEELKARGVL